jgi:hypothetical protein
MNTYFNSTVDTILERLYKATPYGLEDCNLLLEAAQEIEILASRIEELSQALYECRINKNL